MKITPTKNNILIKKIEEKNNFKNIIIPDSIDVNHIMFAQIVAIPKEPLFTKNLKVNDYVILGYSPVWDKKFKHIIDEETYYIVSEHAILSIIVDNNILELMKIEENE